MSSAPGIDRAREIAGESRFLQLCRIGFVGRGVLYILIGLLVVGTGRTEDLTGALQYLDRGSGRVLLMAICAGMVAYGLWRLADGAFGVERPGNDAKALRRRVAVSFIGLVYLYLAWKALRILMSGDPGEASEQQQADSLLDLPGGAVVLAGAAVILAGAGVMQLRKAIRCTFLNSLDSRVATPLVKWLGRVGYAARGVIFLLVSILLGRAAVDGRADKAGGMEQALDILSGPVLYAVAAGLILFGLFSIIEGLFRHIHEPPVDEIKEKVGG